MPNARLTISEVHRRTGIPVTTLRFYEKELPDFFHVEKTTGGHRRYTEASVAQFQAVRRMVDQEGMRLGQLRDRLTPAADSVSRTFSRSSSAETDRATFLIG